MAPTRAELEQRLAPVLAGAPEVLWAYLYGSAARGEAYQDVDIGVMLSEMASGPVPFGQLVVRLESALPNIKLDVVDLASLAPAVAGRIARERHILLDRTPAERAAWEVAANSRALDLEPWLREYERLRRAAFQQKFETKHG